MIKKILFVGASLVFGLGILMASVYRTSAQTLAENLNQGVLQFEVDECSDCQEEVSQATVEAVDYNLPYPGILPGHLFYPLKMIRDRVQLFLTISPLKKTELLLKFADKRIWAAQMLVDQKELEDGLSTATKAEKYLEQAIDQVKVAQEKGEEILPLLEKISQASLKHEEILLGIQKEVGETGQPVVESCLGYARRSYQQAREALEK